MAGTPSNVIETPTTTLGYWEGARGIVVPIRYMLAYAGVPYRFKTYPFRGGATLAECRAPWLEDRPALAEQGLPFPNLPYLIDGDVQLTQSLAILRYLARKHGLDLPDADPGTAARLDMIEAQVNDFRWSLIYHCLGDKYEALRWNFLENIPRELSRFSQFLGHRRWLMGDRLTHVDFMLYEALDQYALFSEGCLDAEPNLKAYADRFRNLEPIKRFLESGDFKPWPVFLPNAAHLSAKDELPKALKKSG
ncbi:putative glutathione S-transferase [Ixodes scapularis]|uniref:glutathione transferase n=1 Tax=Ixodes scapularis TaxID=6945 RepID=B7PB70_IXOSC|nr:glutathione S-transferase, putative [Ixodes scapularis]|eukprot:XP_002407710.1 glutathione S-transferase, putative [Ixodes scapularis]